MCWWFHSQLRPPLAQRPSRRVLLPFHGEMPSWPSSSVPLPARLRFSRAYPTPPVGLSRRRPLPSTPRRCGPRTHATGCGTAPGAQQAPSPASGASWRCPAPARPEPARRARVVPGAAAGRKRKQRRRREGGGRRGGFLRPGTGGGGAAGGGRGEVRRGEALGVPTGPGCRVGVGVGDRAGGSPSRAGGAGPGVGGAGEVCGCVQMELRRLFRPVWAFAKGRLAGSTV